MTAPKTNRKTLRPRRPIRGEELTQTALRELGDLASWQRGTSLTWQTLAERIGVSRQALEMRSVVKVAFNKAKKALTTDQTTPKAILRRDAEQRIALLQARVASLEATIDAYVEKWASIERNCSARGIDPKVIFGDS